MSNIECGKLLAGLLKMMLNKQLTSEEAAIKAVDILSDYAERKEEEKGNENVGSRSKQDVSATPIG